MEEMALAFDDIRLLVSLRHKRNLDPVRLNQKFSSVSGAGYRNDILAQLCYFRIRGSETASCLLLLQVQARISFR